MKIVPTLKRNAYSIAALCAAAPAIAWFIADGNAKQAAADLQLKKELAVADLPMGVNEQRETCIASRLRSAIRQSDSGLVVEPWPEGAMAGLVLVSRNMPYAMRCDRLGGVTEFGAGSENSIRVGIYSVYRPIIGEVDGRIASIPDDEPEIGAHPGSIAASRLFGSICTQMSNFMISVIAEAEVHNKPPRLR